MENSKKNLIEQSPDKDFFNLCDGQAGSWDDFQRLTKKQGVLCWIYQLDGKDTAAVIGEFTRTVAILAVYVAIGNSKIAEHKEFMDDVFMPIAKALECKILRVHRFGDLKANNRWCLIERIWEKQIL